MVYIDEWEDTWEQNESYLIIERSPCPPKYKKYRIFHNVAIYEKPVVNSSSSCSYIICYKMFLSKSFVPWNLT